MTNVITYEDCRKATEEEQSVISNWKNHTQMEAWLIDNGFSYLSEGKCCKVFVDPKKNFVVKVSKQPVRINFNCYFEIQKYRPHATGYSSIDKINASLVKLREIFIEHILYPTLISNDYLCCIQDYLKQDERRITKYFNKQIRKLEIRNKSVLSLGPFENLAWSDKKRQAYIIDIW